MLVVSLLSAGRRTCSGKSFLALAVVAMFGFGMPQLQAQLNVVFNPPWVQQSPATSPAARYGASMAYDAARRQVVLFGGANYAPSGITYSDTWTYDGTTWTQHSVPFPPARFDAVMAYDAAIGQVVLFGGINLAGTVMNDTWAWNGTAWTQQSPSNSPQMRNGASMAYDAATGQLVLFGGRNGDQNIETDTWTYDGTTWTQRSPTNSPPGRFYASMAYASASGQVVLFGGLDFYNDIYGDTWTWDGTTWTQHNLANSPQPRYWAAMASDPSGKVVLFSGDLNYRPLIGDTWVFDGTTWGQQFPSAPVPLATYDTGMANDDAAGQLVMFGGAEEDATGTEAYGTTWAYNLRTQSAGSTNVCSAGSPSPCGVSESLLFVFSGVSGTIQAPVVTTQGASGQDFTDSGTGSCTTNGTSYVYPTSSTACTVVATFAPTAPGLRTGVAKLLSSSGTVLASAAIYGMGTAPQLLFQPGVASTTYSTSLSSGRGLAIDAAGNVYVSNQGASAVLKYAAGSTTATTLVTASAPTTGTAVDGAGNVYYGVALGGSTNLYELVGGAGSPIAIAALPNSDIPDNNLAVDPYGNLYVSGQHSGAIYEITAVTNVVTTVVAGVSGRRFVGMAMDSSGNLFAADYSNNVLYELEAGTSSLTTLATGAPLANPQAVAVDAAGNLYVANAGGTSVYRYAASNYAATPALLAANGQYSLAIGTTGTLYSISGNSLLSYVRTANPALAFASTAVATTSTDSPKTVTLENDGNLPLTLAVPSTGGNPSISTGFTIGNTSTCPQLTQNSSAGMLESGASCTDVVSFSPMTSGTFSGSLTTADNSLNVASSTQAVALTGPATLGSKTITFPQPPSQSYGTSYTLTATASNGDPVTYSITSGPATLSGSVVSYTGVGPVVIAANSSANANYNAAATVSDTVTIAKANKTITFPQPPAQFPSTTYTLTATASNGDPVTYSITSGPATISGSVVTYTGSGSVVIAADSAANTNYSAAATVSDTVTIAKGNKTITFPQPPAQFPSTTYTLTATSSDGDPVTYSITSGPATISGSVVTYTGSGSVVIAADSAATAHYNSAPTVSDTVVIAKGNKTITFPQPPAQLVNTSYTLTATASNGDSVTYSITSGPATLSGSVVTYTDAGTVVIAADSASTAEYNAAPTVSDNVTVTYPGAYTATTTAVGSTSATQTAYVNFASAGTLGTISVLTQGAVNKDYKQVAGGTCTIGTAYAAGQGCSVLYSLTASRPGLRMGAISLTSNTGSVVLGTSFLNGVGTGPQITFPGSSSITSIGSGFSNPQTVAVDGNGNVFVADYGNNAVMEIVAMNGVASSSSMVNTVGSGFSNPFGVAVDGSGNVFVGDSAGGVVKKIVAVNGVVSSSSSVVTIASGFNQSRGLTVDGSGDVLVADTSNSLLKEIVAVNGVVSATSTVITVGSGLSYPEGMAVDGSGNVFVADYGGSVVREVVAVNGMVSSSSTVNTVGSGFLNPFCVAVDASGDVFVADANNNAVKEIVAVNGIVNSSSTVNTVGSGFHHPQGIVMDGSGHLIVADNSNIAVKEIDLTAAPAQVFATTSVGATSSDSPRSVAVQNEGNAALTFTSLAMAGAANFPVSGTGTCGTGSPLAVSGICTIAASFTPQGTGVLTGTFTLTDNTINVAGSTQVVSLSGTGTPPAVTFGTMSFSPAASEPQGTSQAVTISDTVSYNYVIPTGAVTFVLNGVTYTATCTTGGSPETCSATVSAATTAALGINTYTVTVAAAADSNYSAATGASGTFVISAPTAYTAQATAVGATSPTQTAYVNVTTAGTLGTVYLLTQGAMNKDFKMVPGGTCMTGTAYAVGQACTVLYSFTPARPAQRLGAVSLSDSTGTVVLGNSFLNGVGTGPLAVFPGSTALSTFGNGFSNPSGVAIDGNGNTFITDYSHSLVKEIVAVNGVTGSNPAILSVGSGFVHPTAVAIDGDGNVFVVGYLQGSLKEIVAVNGAVSANSTMATVGNSIAYFDPTGLAVDGSGDVFVCDQATGAPPPVQMIANRVSEIVAANGVVTSGSAVNTVGSGFTKPAALAVDANGNVFVADAGSNSVKKIVAVNGVVSSSSTVTTVATGFSAPVGLAMDAGGDLFVSDTGHSLVKEIVAVNGIVSSSSKVNTVGSGFSGPEGLAVDGSGHIFVADYNNNAMKEIDLTAAPAQIFASTSAGTTSSDSPRSVTVQNAGNAALTFTSIATGTTSFPVSASGTCSLSTPLAQSGVCTLAASFTPQQAGAQSDTLTATDNSLNAPGSAQSVVLSGTGTAGAGTKAIAFVQPASPAAAGTSATLAATASNGDAVTFSVTAGTGTASISGSVITYLTQGTVMVNADSAAAGSYSAAPTVSYTVTITDIPSVFLAGSGSVGSLNAAGGVSTSAVMGGGKGAAVDANGTTWSLNSDGVSVSAFTAAGALSASYAPTGLTGASALAIDGNSSLWVTNGNGSITQVSNAGTTISTTTGSTTAAPTAVAIDNSGNVWVVNAGADTIDEIIGGAAPAAPLANVTPGVKP
jgi:sugar lactone lactonase YvrE